MKCYTTSLNSQPVSYPTVRDCLGQTFLCDNFLISLFLQPSVVDLRYFKLWILLDQIVKVWNIKVSTNKWPQKYKEYLSLSQFLFSSNCLQESSKTFSWKKIWSLCLNRVDFSKILKRQKFILCPKNGEHLICSSIKRSLFFCAKRINFGKPGKF